MKNMALTKLLLVLLIVVMAAGMAACGNSGKVQESGTIAVSDTQKDSASKQTEKASKPVTLKVINYHVGNDYAAPFFKKLFEEFPKSELGKGISFDFEEIPNQDAYSQKLKLLMASSNLPDVVLSAGVSLTDLAVKAGKVADLTPYFETDQNWKSQFDSKSL